MRTTMKALFLGLLMMGFCVWSPSLSLAADVTCEIKRGELAHVGYNVANGTVFVVWNPAGTTNKFWHGICNAGTGGTACRDLQAMLLSALLGTRGLSLSYAGPYTCNNSWGGGAANTGSVRLVYINK